MADTQDIKHALQQGRTLRVTMSLGGDTLTHGVSDIAIEDIRAQLRSVCQAMETLLDKVGKIVEPPRRDSVAAAPSKSNGDDKPAAVERPILTAMTKSPSTAALFDPVPTGLNSAVPKVR